MNNREISFASVGQKRKGGKNGSKDHASRITRIYSLPIDGQRIEVCQFYFLNTLAISQKRVRYTLAQKANFVQDERGHHQPHNKTNKAELIVSGPTARYSKLSPLTNV